MKLWHETLGTGPGLVLLHGWGMNSAVWQPVLEQLQQQYAVTCVDLPGHGFNQDYDTEGTTLKDWVDAVIDVVPENATWLGWSMGGLIALQAALLYPEKISGLVMMTATPSFMQRDNWSCAMPATTLNTFADNLKQDVKSTLTRFLSLQINGCDNARDLLKQLKQGFSARPAASRATLETGLSFLQNENLLGELSQLKIRSLWVYGEKDTLVPACAAEAILASVPEAEVKMIQAAGHVPFLSHFNECLALLKTWKPV